VPTVDQWNTKESPSDTLGKFVPPQNWELPSKQSLSANGEAGVVPRQPGLHMKRATSNWGMGFIDRFLNGDHDHEQMSARKNGTGVNRPMGVEKPMSLDDERGFESGAK
jgi:hypothetical protein